MKLFTWRMQNRQCGVVAAIVTIGSLMMCIHLFGELKKLGLCEYLFLFVLFCDKCYFERIEYEYFFSNEKNLISCK